MIGVFIILLAMASATDWPTMSFAQEAADVADGTGDITVVNATTCTTTVNTIQCNSGNSCGYNKKVWWDVQNNHNQRARVAVVNLRHQDSGLYIDPLRGPGNKSEHVVVVNADGASETLKTRVRKHRARRLPYKY